ncbi:MAG: sporulation protein YqfD [Eubacteriales bacterium]
MEKITNFLRGKEEISVTAPFPQRLLNLCAQENLPFWGLVWLDDSHISLTIPKQEYGHLQTLARKIQGEVIKTRSQGLPMLLSQLRHRSSFLLGFTLSLLAVTFLSRFVLFIDITGNETIETAVIRSALEKAGLHTGSYGPSLSLSNLQQHLLSQVEGMSWASINLHGTRVEVTVRESVPPPEIYPTEGLYDIISTATGIVEEIQVHQGEKMVAAGDTITKGQVLISGSVELKPPLYSENPSQWLSVPSSGKIMARTWHQLVAVIPLSVQVKETYGVPQNAYEFFLLGEKWTLFENPVIFLSHYDKIRESYHFPSLETLPVAITHITQSPYRLNQSTINQQYAREMLEQSLLEEIESLLGDTGELLQWEFTAVEKNNTLQVTLSAECRQEIGILIEGSPRQEILDES